jgi:gamma-glutamyl-gamma-aminobutyrate hydrolase PuuD
VRIGVTDPQGGDDFRHYVAWLRAIDQSLDITRLSYRDRGKGTADAVDGLLLTGGGDVHPGLYGRPEDLGKSKRVDERRDEFEFELLDRALEDGLPVFGVCRGMQTINVFLGGSLVPDLVSAGFDDHTSPANRATTHRISIVPNSTLHALAGKTEIEVNSYHHQAVERPGRGLAASASSSDGVIEAVEWAMKDRMPFLAAVQWHPELARENVLSQKLARIFLREVHHQYSMNSH